jgi:hypothetical protein
MVAALQLARTIALYAGVVCAAAYFVVGKEREGLPLALAISMAGLWIGSDGALGLLAGQAHLRGGGNATGLGAMVLNGGALSLGIAAFFVGLVMLLKR